MPPRPPISGPACRFPARAGFLHVAAAVRSFVRSIGLVPIPIAKMGRSFRWIPLGSRREDDPMRLRLLSALVVLFAVLDGAGCSTVSQWVMPGPPATNPLVVPSSDFETVWRECVAVLDEYFDIASENRLSGTIVTQPVIGATLLEPWRGDTVGLSDRFESTIQTIRRHGRITVNPAPGGGFLVKVEVFKELEDLSKPDRQSMGRAVFNNDFPVNRTYEIVGPVPLPLQYIPRGRDPKLEQVVLDRIRNRLFL
jgi:hypothetical protein